MRQVQVAAVLHHVADRRQCRRPKVAQALRIRALTRRRCAYSPTASKIATALYNEHWSGTRLSPQPKECGGDSWQGVADIDGTDRACLTCTS